MMYEINLAWVTANPQAALDMIDRLMRERDDAKALAAASAAGYAGLVASAGADYSGAPAGYKVPDGYAVVPKVPTADMTDAGAEMCEDAYSGRAANAVWAAMLEAALIAAAPDASVTEREGSDG